MIAVASTSVTIREASPAELERWDDMVRSFEHCRVTHLRAWVESLVSSGCGRALYLVIEKDGDVVACFPGLIATVGGLKLFGSPLEGWQTISMGPVFDPARITTREILDAALPWLEREHKVVHIEMLHLGLDEGAMRASGFEGEPVWTYRAPLLPRDEAKTFKAMKDSARRNVKRAQRLGLIAKLETDESFVAEHYAQLREVYLRGGHVIPFSERRIRECFRAMQAAGNLVAIAIYLPDATTCIATGMFFIEGTELSLWMWAHKEHYRWYRPTELLTWTAMQIAVGRGCDTFDFMGRGDFKAKFGAELDDTKRRWLRSRPKWLATARGIAGSGFRIQQTIRGRVGQMAARVRHNDKHVVPAVVLGDVDLVRALGIAGIPSVVVAPPGNASRFSRTTKDALPWIDPWDRSAELVEELVAYGLAQPEPPVLMYQEDRSLLLVSRHRDRLKQAFRFVVADAKLIEQLVDKHAFQQLAAKLGLPVPAARAVNPAEEPMPDMAAFTFPVIVKPITRRNDRWQQIATEGKALRVDSADALRALWPKLADARAAVLVQSIVEGPESAIESYHVYAGDKGEILAEFTGKKIRTYPAAYGDTTALEIVDLADVAALGRDAVAKLKLTGVAKIDFKRAPDGQLFLLEVNPRFTLWNHPGALAGINIPAMVHGDLIGRERKAAAPVTSGVRWCKVWSDAPAARASGVSMSQWFSWMLGCKAKSAFAWDDPMPLLGAALWRWLGRTRHSSTSPDTSARLIPNPVVSR